MGAGAALAASLPPGEEDMPLWLDLGCLAMFGGLAGYVEGNTDTADGVDNPTKANQS